MIKRILYALVGAAAAAVMISAVTHAVDFDQTTFEDGDGRYAIAAVGALVFLVCLYLLVADLAGARRANHLPEDEVEYDEVPATFSDRLATTRPADTAATTQRRGPIIVTQPAPATAASPVRSEAAAASSASPRRRRNPAAPTASSVGGIRHSPKRPRSCSERTPTADAVRPHRPRAGVPHRRPAPPSSGTRTAHATGRQAQHRVPPSSDGSRRRRRPAPRPATPRSWPPSQPPLPRQLTLQHLLRPLPRRRQQQHRRLQHRQPRRRSATSHQPPPRPSPTLRRHLPKRQTSRSSLLRSRCNHSARPRHLPSPSPSPLRCGTTTRPKSTAPSTSSDGLRSMRWLPPAR
ncbi:MAG: hypothetical protein R2710_18310 [Acidimicrobiales bacterium]